MDGNAIAAVWPELNELLDKHMAITDRLLEHCTHLTEHAATMRTELELLGDRIGVVHAQTIMRDNAITEQLDALDERLTSVHRAALRTLNLTPGGEPAA